MAQEYQAKDVQGLWEARTKDFTQSRARIKAVRDWQAGKVTPVIPETFTAGVNIADLAVQLPHSTTVPLHSSNVLGRKRPLIKREPLGKGIAPQRKSTRIERWTNATLAELEKQSGPIFAPLMDGRFRHGESAALCYPTTAGWETFPQFNGEDGQPDPKFQRNKDGRDPEDEYFTEPGTRRQPFALDMKASKGAYEDYLEDFKSRRIPLSVRIVPAEQCIPLFGPGNRLDGLLIRSTYSEDDLTRKGYRWIGGDKHPGPGMTDGGTLSSSLGRTHSLTELWLPGSVCYFVGDKAGKLYETSRKREGEDTEAEINLAREYGLQRLLATYGYGLNIPSEEDPDLRGIPFLHPFLSSYAGVNNLATAAMAHAWRYGFMGFGVVPGADTPQELYMENGKARTFEMNPWEIVVLPGPTTPLVHTGPGPDVDKMMNLLMGGTREEGPSAGAFGGPGPQSGHDRSLLRAHLEDAMSQVPDGVLETWEWLGQTLLECGTAVARKSNHALPVYVTAPADGESGTRRSSVTLTQDLCDDVWDVSAFYPNAEGENLPWAQMLAEWSLKGLIPQRQFLEKGLGDESPEDTMVEIQVETMLFKTPEGQAYIQQLASELIGDERWKEMHELITNGQAAPDGTPTAAMNGMQPQQPQQGELMGTSMPNAVNSAVGGIIAGGIQSGPQVLDAAATQGQGI